MVSLNLSNMTIFQCFNADSLIKDDQILISNVFLIMWWSPTMQVYVDEKIESNLE